MRLSERTTRLFMGVVVAAGLFLAATGNAYACGMEDDCIVGDRTYRLMLPEGHDASAPLGALVFAHGYQGKAAGSMRSDGLTGLANRLGVALIALQSKTDSWSLPGTPGGGIKPGIDELAYIDAVLTDVSERISLDGEQIVMSGFSTGGMFVWHVACNLDGTFAGYIPLSGTFWEPMPTTCDAAPAKLVHYHGRQDKTVPLEGRAIANTRQGNVFNALNMFAVSGRYGAAEKFTDGELSCTRQDAVTGEFLELCLFDGKHGVRVAHIERAWNLIFTDQAG